MTDMIKTDTMPVETTASEIHPTAQPIPAQAPAAYSGISLKTALRILDTICKNGHEGVGFWAAKTAYSGVYRTAVNNGWIVDGLFVTDIPEGVDGGFLAADMRRISLMARLLSDVLSDRLEEETPSASSYADTTALQNAISTAVEEHLRTFLSESALDAAISESFESALEELEALKEEIETLKDDVLAEIEAAKEY